MCYARLPTRGFFVQNVKISVFNQDYFAAMLLALEPLKNGLELPLKYHFHTHKEGILVYAYKKSSVIHLTSHTYANSYLKLQGGLESFFENNQSIFVQLTSQYYIL